MPSPLGSITCLVGHCPFVWLRSAYARPCPRPAGCCEAACLRGLTTGALPMFCLPLFVGLLLGGSNETLGPAPIPPLPPPKQADCATLTPTASTLPSMTRSPLWACAVAWGHISPWTGSSTQGHFQSRGSCAPSRKQAIPTTPHQPSTHPLYTHTHTSTHRHLWQPGRER